MTNTIVVIRDYKPGDDICCKELIREATMSTVNASFMTGLTQEITFQGIVICAAVMFIFLGVPLSYCLGAIPVFLFLMYVFIWLGHTMKAIELTQEMNNIARMYMSSQRTGFWVAEVYDPPLLLGGVKKNFRFETVTEKEFMTRNISVNPSKKVFSVTLQSEEEIEASCQKITQKSPCVVSYNKCHEFCISLKYTQLVLPIPLHVTPDFSSDVVSLKWRLHFEFVTTSQPNISETLSDDSTNGTVWQGPSSLDIETMIWNLPIKIYPTMPANISQVFQSQCKCSIVI